MSRKFNIILSLLVMTTLSLCAGDDLRKSMPVSCKAELTARAVSHPFYAAVFTSEMYKFLNDSYTNLRIYDSKGQQVPYVVRPVMKNALVTSSKTYIARIKSLSRLGDSKSIIELVVSGPKQKNREVFIVKRIMIDTPLKNFEKTITVFGSNDCKSWKTLVAEAKIYDYSSIVNLRNTVINIPASQWDFYKLKIVNFSEVKAMPGFNRLIKKNSSTNNQSVATQSFYRRVDFKVSNITLEAQASVDRVDRRLTSWKPAFVDAQQKTGKSDVFEIYTSQEPLVAVKVKTNSVNFARYCKLEYVDESGKSHNISGKKIFSYDLPGIIQHDLTLRFNEQQHEHYRLMIENKDNLPLENISFKLESNNYQAVLLGKGVSMPLQLYFGGKNIPAPDYDVDDILAKVKSPEFTRLKLDAAISNTSFDQALGGSKKYRKLIMYGAFGAVVLVLVVILALSLKKVESIPLKED
ncbi:MAG: hypothetical protein GY750_00475 [Lentisphaerae bacterium]|nr:hypothetical protein [Lentisphaerota bacterium]MCP4099895.1 hypothetical protein [Lentisphaerota bacterium]